MRELRFDPDVLDSWASTSGDYPASEALAGLVDSLDEPYRSAVNARFYEQLSYEDIAKRAGPHVSRATATAWVKQGLARIKAQVEAMQVPES